MRNIAEKMRRDKLNNYVTELASIVPLVSGANKRVDKTSVLRLAANFIRIHKILQDSEPEKQALPGAMDSVVSQSLSQAIGGFLMVVTSTGKVLYVSEAMEEIFGHSQVDLLGRSIYHVIHPEDYEIIQEQLNSKDTSRRSFFCRMMEKALSRNDPSRYEIVHIVGSIRMLLQSAGHDQVAETARDSCDKSLSDGEDRMGSDSDGDDAHSAPAVSKVGTHLLVAFVRVVKDRPITELSLVESTQDEYITRHSMDGKILYTDHRISFVTGLMPQEVLGTSAFHYMHPDDLVWSIVAHKLMFSSSQGQGMVSYRLKCKGSKFVTLRSRGYIESNKQTGQAETFVCINTVVSSKETENEIKSQRRKLLPMVTSPQGDNHLTTVSSAMPPELLSAMKKMLDPQYVKKLFDSIDDMGFEVSIDKLTATKPDWKEDEEAAFPQQVRNSDASVPGANNRSRDEEFSDGFSASKNSKKRALERTFSPQPKKFCSSEFFRGQEVLHSTNSIPEQNQSFCQSDFSHSRGHNSSLLASPPQNMACDMSPARAKQGPANTLRSYYDSVLPQPPRSSEGGGPARGLLHPELRKGFHHDHTAQNTSTNQGKECHGGGGVPSMCENPAADAVFSNQGFQNNPRRVETPCSYRQSEANSSPMYPSIAAQNHHFPQNSPSLLHSPQARTFPQGEQAVVPSFPHSNQTDQNFHFSSRMDVLISTQRQQQQYMQQSERQQLQMKQQSLKQQDAAQNNQDQHRQHSQQNQQTQQLNYQVHINCQQSLQNYQPSRSYQQARQQQEQQQKTGQHFQSGAIYQQSIQTKHSVQSQQSELHLKQLNLRQQPEMHHQQDMHHQHLRQHNQVELQHQQSRHQQSEQQYQQTRQHQPDTHHQQRRQHQHHLHQQQPGQNQCMSHQAHDRPHTQLNANVRGPPFPSGQIQQNPSLQHWQSSPPFCQNGNYGLYDPLSIASSSSMHLPGSTAIQTKSSGPQF